MAPLGGILSADAVPDLRVKSRHEEVLFLNEELFEVGGRFFELSAEKIKIVIGPADTAAVGDHKGYSRKSEIV